MSVCKKTTAESDIVLGVAAMSNREGTESALRQRLERDRSAYLRAREEFEKIKMRPAALPHPGAGVALKNAGITNAHALRSYSQSLKNYNRVYFARTHSTQHN